MITVARRMARHVRAVFRLALNITSRSLGPPVTFQAGPEGLSVRAKTHEAAAELQMPGDFPSEQITAPWQLLTDCQAAKDEPVTIEDPGDGRTMAQWRDGSIPQLITYDPPTLVDKRPFPNWPKKTVTKDARLLSALHDAMLTTNVDSVRYATNCVQLDAQRHRIVATDGRQLLVQTGFEFPWEGTVLIPRTLVFGSRELPRDEPVEIGMSKKWLSIRVGAWTFHFAIDEERRFPAVDDHIQTPDTAQAQLELADNDAVFLADALKRLPCHDAYHQPITLDLNGQCVVRAKPEDQGQITELLLLASTCGGEPLRLSSNRSYLARAIQLGFRRLLLFGDKVPVQCQDENRTYLWALLEPNDALQPTDNAVRIESRPDEPPQQPVTQQRKQISPMKSSTTTKTDNGRAAKNGQATAGGASEHGVDGLIQQAETLKVSLRQALAQTGDLIAALKAHKKQNRAVESALSSLRQLQAVDA